jgi:hypothetical protein
MAGTDKKKISFERFQIISELVKCQRRDSAELTKIRRRISEETGISVRTLYRWELNFMKNSLEGLEPKSTGRPGNQVLDQKIIEMAIKMRVENPRRSLKKICITIEIFLGLEKGSIKRTTLHDNLAKLGYSKADVIAKSGEYGESGNRFQRTFLNDLWQSDVKHACYINNKKAYLVSFIDDATRYITFSQFMYSEATESIMTVMRKAIEKCGRPNTVYFDNGSAYRSKAVMYTLSKLHIQKLHTKPRRAQSKGKIEKFHQVVDQFLSEHKLERASSLEDLNYKWSNYLETYYQTVPHDGLKKGMTPFKAYSEEKNDIRLVTKAELDEAFTITVEGRRVDKSGCVNFKGKQWVADNLSSFIGRKVNVIWDPIKSLVWISPSDGIKMSARVLFITNNVPKRHNKPNPDVDSKPSRSRFLEAAEIDNQNKKAELEKMFSSHKFGSANEAAKVPMTESIVIESLADSPDDDQRHAEGVISGTEIVAEERRPLIDFNKLIHDESEESHFSSISNDGQGDDCRAILFGAFNDSAGDD